MIDDEITVCGSSIPFRLCNVSDRHNIDTGGISMKQITLKKLVMTALLAALAVVCSPLSIPVGISKCFPAQHFVNIIGGVFLGPWYAMAAAFVTSLCRVLMGTGTLMAFPGSMIGAFLSGMLYRKLKKLPFAYAGELFGTAVIGGIIAFVLATQFMGKEAALFTYVPPFFLSSLSGTIIAAILVPALKKAGVDRFFAEDSRAKTGSVKQS